MNYTPAQINRLIADVYSGTATPQDIPEDLYFAIADNLKKALYQGFGGAVADFSGKPEALLTELRTNVYMFSAAKSYQQMREYTDLLYTEEGLRSFKDFKQLALGKFEQYNVDWLATERQTAIASGQQGYLWNKIEDEAELFPFLTFTAVMDKNTTDECSHLNGITAKVGDPVWRTCYPPNHWNCRSSVIQTDSASILSSQRTIRKAKEESEAEMQSVFKMNVGLDKYVYSPEHPYFQVAPKDRALAVHNFNLPIPPPVRKAPTRRVVPPTPPTPPPPPPGTLLEGDYAKTRVLLEGDAKGESLTRQDHFVRLAGIPHGFEGNVTVTGTKGGRVMSVAANSKDGKITMLRTIDFDKLQIQNTFTEVKSGSKWKGKHAALFRQQVDYADARAFMDINVEASRGKGANGYYVWQRLGYRYDLRQGANPSSHNMGEVIGKFNTEMNQMGANVRASNLRELMATQKGQEWWKANGFTHAARFDLTDDYCRRTLQNYLEEKGLVKKAKVVVPKIPKAPKGAYPKVEISGSGKNLPMDEQVHFLKTAGIPNNWDGVIEVKDLGNEIVVRASNRWGTMNRTITKADPARGQKGKCSNDYFRLEDKKGSPYKGKGVNIFKGQVDYLTKSGYSHIDVHAARGGDFNGYYTWWRFGYKITPEVNNQAAKMESVVNRFNRELTPGRIKVKDIYELRGTKDGADHWKEHGFDFYGKFDLTKGSDAQNALKKYANERAKQGK